MADCIFSNDNGLSLATWLNEEPKHMEAEPEYIEEEPKRSWAQYMYFVQIDCCVEHGWESSHFWGEVELVIWNIVTLYNIKYLQLYDTVRGY